VTGSASGFRIYLFAGKTKQKWELLKYFSDYFYTRQMSDDVAVYDDVANRRRGWDGVGCKILLCNM